MRLRRQPSSGLTLDPTNPKPIFNDPTFPDEPPEPGQAPGQAGGSGGSGGGVPPLPPAAPPPMMLPGALPGADPSTLFQGNYVPLQNYLYANQGRQITPTANGAPAVAADGTTTPAAPGSLGAYGLDQALLGQASPATSVPGADPTGGAGGTGSGVPQQPTPTGPPHKPGAPVTQLVAGGQQQPPMVAQQTPDTGSRLRKYFYPGQSN